MKHFSQLSTVLLFSVLFIYACKKEVNRDYSIQGKMENWTLAGNKVMKLCYFNDTMQMTSPPFTSFGVSSIDTNGSFNLTSFAIPSNNLRIPLDSIFGTTIVLSDPSAKATRAILLVFSGNSDYPSGSAVYGNVTNYITSGSYYECYIFVDKSVSITGTGIRTYGDGMIMDTENYSCNLNLKQGWNKYIQKVVSVGLYTEFFEISNDQFPDTKWEYQNIEK